jgi:transcriptional regulator with XRE-family HTH domain
MGAKPSTLGGKIAELRRAKHLSQRQLAEKILRDDGVPISPQYLNDIERDRRVPPDYILDRIARVLEGNRDYLVFLAGRIPPSLAFLSDEVRFVAFRKNRKTS